ncbi:MAG: dienelactone hydrolase family protein [Acidobacteriota bacterium]|nr:dienelactone hydrolase family protein [Acidobacteriota bacterium]
MSRLPKLLAAAVLLSSTALLHAQDWAKAALLKSPRHYEFAPIKHGDRTVETFVVYPETNRKAPVIVMIHEIFGLSDWAKLMADELAAKGYIVVAPDLLSGAGPNGGGTDAFAPSDVNAAVSRLNADQVTADLDAAADYGKKLPAANGKTFVAGFCWGGGKSFGFAAHRQDLSAAFVFYGTPPSDVTAVSAPVYGFYAGNDARITATVPATTEAMKAAGKKYDPVTYDGAGHGFMRAGQAPDASDANKKAYQEGFSRLTSVIDKLNAGTTSRLQKPAPRAPVQTKPAVAAVSCHDASTSSDAKHDAAMDMAAIM